MAGQPTYRAGKSWMQQSPSTDKRIGAVETYMANHPQPDTL